MNSGKQRILLVMHKMPLDSGFLASKFIVLSNHFDVHLLVWDARNSIDKFIETYRLPSDYRRKIHLGNDRQFSVLKVLYCLMVCILTSGKVRQYLLKGDGGFWSRMKFIISYLPALFIKPDVIHFEFGTLAKAGVELKHISDAKLSVSFRGYDLNYSGLSDKEYYDKVWLHIDGFHFLGNDIKKRAIERGYVQKQVEALIPPGVNTDVFNAAINADKYNENLLRIVSVGRLVWKKGYEYGIQAAARLKAKGIFFTYSIVGDGPHRQALEYTIHELGLEKEVLLLGNKNAIEIKQELQQAHVFLHPAISEGFSNAVVEAQAMGVPVICSDADGLAENVADNVTGFVIPKWDVESITEKLEWCSQHKSDLPKMGLAGQERVKENFTLEEQVAAFVNFYNRLLDK